MIRAFLVTVIPEVSHVAERSLYQNEVRKKSKACQLKPLTGKKGEVHMAEQATPTG